MKRILLILILQNSTVIKSNSQSFTVDDLIALASSESKNIGDFMKRNGFVLTSSKSAGDSTEASFTARIKGGKKGIGLKRSIDVYLKEDFRCLTLHTTSLNEYLAGQQRLIKSGFFYDDQKDISKEPAILFQKKNITIQTSAGEVA